MALPILMLFVVLAPTVELAPSVTFELLNRIALAPVISCPPMLIVPVIVPPDLSK